MAPIDPYPRVGARTLGERVKWSDSREVIFDLMPMPIADRTFDSVLRSRRSVRMILPASTKVVAAVVRETLKADFIGAGERVGQRRKAVVSAGALHPVKAVIISPDEPPLYYDDGLDRFLALSVLDQDCFQSFHSRCSEVLPNAKGHWVALIADCKDLARMYSSYEALLWRDAGAAIQTMAMIAEAFDLAFCPLGILGHEIVQAIREDANDLVAVGVVALGFPSEA